jgi:hypothetical protein
MAAAVTRSGPATSVPLLAAACLDVQRETIRLESTVRSSVGAAAAPHEKDCQMAITEARTQAEMMRYADFLGEAG